MATVERVNIGLLNDKITIQLDRQDYLPAFEKKVKEYSKTMNVPGFRKGMVPVGMVKKMYGSSIFTDEVLKTVEKELFAYLQKENPEIFAQPMALPSDLQKMDHNQPAAYQFSFEIGLKPSFDIAPLKKASVTLHKINVTEEMVQEEVVNMQNKAGKMTEPETIESEESVLNILFTETDEQGQAVENGVVKENSVMLKHFTAEGHKKIKGLSKDSRVVMQLSSSFEAETLSNLLQDLGFDKSDSVAAAKYFQLSIVKIGLVEKAALDETLFNQAFPGGGVTNETELRNKLKEEIEKYWLGQSRNQLHDQLYHYLLDHTKIEFPEPFLKRWLQTGGEKPKSPEEAEAEYPLFSNQLKWTLISDQLVKENQLEVGRDELKESMRNEVMRYFGSMSLGEDTSWLDSYIDRMMKDEKHVESTYRRILMEKLFNWAEGQVKPAEKTVTPEELAGMMHNHQH